MPGRYSDVTGAAGANQTATVIAKRIPGNKPFDLEHAPERLWIYTDVYGVLRAAVYGPHKTRPSVQYVRADIAHASPPPP